LLKRKEAQVKALLGRGRDLSESVRRQSAKPMLFLLLCKHQPGARQQSGIFPARMQDKLLTHHPITIISCDLAADFKGLFHSREDVGLLMSFSTTMEGHVLPRLQI